MVLLVTVCLLFNYINILLLAVVWHGVAIPVLWETLDKKGNSNTGERMVLLELFRETFPEVHIETLYAAGVHWQ